MQKTFATTLLLATGVFLRASAMDSCPDGTKPAMDINASVLSLPQKTADTSGIYNTLNLDEVVFESAFVDLGQNGLARKSRNKAEGGGVVAKLFKGQADVYPLAAGYKFFARGAVYRAAAYVIYF